MVSLISIDAAIRHFDEWWFIEQGTRHTGCQVLQLIQICVIW
jgi:hypothetical protein